MMTSMKGKSDKVQLVNNVSQGEVNVIPILIVL